MTDPIMTDITAAVTLAHEGDAKTACTRLQDLWEQIGPAGDPFHRCTLAHYMADLYDDPAQALVWDVRALDAAAELTDERVQRHHSTLNIAGFYPSLHLNLADNFRRLGSFEAARNHIDAARQHQDALADDGYGTLIRGAISEIGEAIDQRNTRRRATAPGAR
jgi:hypothetical protein